MRTRNAVFTGVLTLGLAWPTVALSVSYEELTDNAKRVVDAVKAESDANAVCESRDTLRPVLVRVVRSLRDSDALRGDPRPDARVAGAYLSKNCGSL